MTDWINEFVAATEGINSPEIFRKWGAIYALSAAMERKVWVRTGGSDMFPNLYVIFVAPAGVGKSESTWRAREVITSLEDHFIAPSSVTKASLIDALAAAKRVATQPLPDEPLRFNSLPIVSNELGVLIPKYDMEFMAALTDLWDCKPYEETRRTKELKIKIEKPQLGLLAACTPDYLRTTLPEGAWEQGFLSRTMLIFSGETTYKDMFDESDEDDKLAGVKASIKDRGKIVGKMEFTAGAKEAFRNWHKNKCEPAPKHPKLTSYSTRRPVHLVKLSMIASMSESTSLIITQEHILRALDWMVEIEHFMPGIFKAMVTGGTSKIIEECYFYLYTEYNKAGKSPISEYRLHRFLMEKAPFAHQIPQIIELMKSSKLIKEMLGKGGKEFIPLMKES